MPLSRLKEFHISHPPLKDLAQNFNWSLAQKLLENETQAAPEITDIESCRAALLVQKQQKQLAFIRDDLSLQDKSGAGHVGETYRKLTKDWSQFADDSLDLALRWGWQDPRVKKNMRDLPSAGDAVPGLFALGLGKLGGRDLNFSSDVDLVAFYDKDKVPAAPYQGKTDICANVLRTMGSKMIDGLSTTGKFVWRVDWRLRPDPSVTDLVISTEAGEDFYFFRSASWRRLAMMKARVVAGDKEVGAEFMARLHPFIWRRHLDYRSIDEIAALKYRIKAEHPNLASERAQDNPLDEAEGFNLKLGRGGIREIEFFINAQQLLWGGRIPALQTANSLDALEVMVQEGMVEKEIASGLREAYLLLRALENRMQYWADGHTHFLPNSNQTEQQEWLATISGFTSWYDLTHQLNEMRHFVSAQFDTLFAAQEQEGSSAQQTTLELSAQLGRLSPPQKEIAEDWLDGFGNYSVTADQRNVLKDLGARFVSLIVENENPELAITKVHHFISSMVVPGQYLRLLAENEALVKDVMHPLLRSHIMERLLSRSPHLIDGLLRIRGRSKPEPDLEIATQMIAASQTTEKKLEAMRAWCNEQKYQIYLTLFRGDCKIEQAEHYLTKLAELTLELAATQVCDDMELDHLPFSILAMGKLGMRHMTPGSDLDLIFICQDGTDLDQANKVSRRFQNVLGAKMREGRLYEIDMRLRPSGSSGPPTVSLTSFKNYHFERAKTWEHLALVPARIVYGTAEMQQQIETVRHQVLTSRRDEQQMIDDSWKMLNRLRDQRISTDIGPDVDVKLWSGGGMETEYLLGFLGLKFTPQKPQIAQTNFDEICPILGEIDPALQPLAQTIRFWRDLQFRHRLLNQEEQKLKDDNSQLMSDIHSHQSYVLEQLSFWLEQRTTLKDTDLEDYREQPIKWIDQPST